MNGRITKYRKMDKHISCGYCSKAKGRYYSECGSTTKFDAFKAPGAALVKLQDVNGIPRNGDPRTLVEYLPYWLDNHAAPRCQPKTLKRYRQLAEYLTRLLGRVPILDLKPGIIQESVNLLLLRGGTPTKAHPHGRPRSRVARAVVAAAAR